MAQSEGSDNPSKKEERGHYIYLYPSGGYEKNGFNPNDMMPHPLKPDEIMRIYRYEVDGKGAYVNGDDEGGKKRRKYTDVDGETKDMIFILRIETTLAPGDSKRKSSGFTRLHSIRDRDVLDQLRKHPANEEVTEYDGNSRMEKFAWYPILFRLEDPLEAQKRAVAHNKAKNEVFADIDGKEAAALEAACVMMGLPITNTFDGETKRKDPSELKQALIEFVYSKSPIDRNKQRVTPSDYYRNRVMKNGNLEKEFFVELCLAKKVFIHTPTNGYSYIFENGRGHKTIGNEPADIATFLNANPSVHEEINKRIDWNRYRKVFGWSKPVITPEDKNLTELVKQEPATPNVQQTEMMSKLLLKLEEAEKREAEYQKERDELNKKLVQITETQKAQSDLLVELKIGQDKPEDSKDNGNKPPKK